VKCPQCQHENPADAVFCQECGARLEAACPSCGTPNHLGVKFCKKCGQRLSQPEALQALSGPRFGSPQSYTPRHLAERILTSKAALEGERKEVTVLFADLKGSMELLADRDPEEARKILDPVLGRMMEAVHRYEGTVNQVMGDGIMALFGAPVAHEDHAVRASYAALRMQESVKRYAEEVQRTAGIPIQIRVGLNSGEVVVRSIGSDLHMDYTAVGQTTHLAARLEQMAMAGSILMSADGLRLAEGFVQVKPLGGVAVKGLPEPMDVYELIGAGVARTRLQVAVARGLSRFIGRDAELEALRRSVEKAGTSHGQVVGLVGEPGVGKSRLFWEFTHSHRTQGWLVLDSGSVSYGKATPYLPVIDLLKAYFKVQDRDGPREVREKVTGKLLTLDRSLEPTLPALLALLDVPEPDPAWQALEPAQRRHRTLQAVKRLLLRESQVQPLLVIFEDLHWVDGETQGLLDSLIESLPAARVLLLVNYRPEYQHAWGSKTYYTQLRLDALPAESAGELLVALLGGDASLAPLTQMLIDRTGGNPFFLEESVRALAETKALLGERGAYRVARPLETLQAPTSVQAVLAARIDRLAPEDKRLLQSAAVIGKDVPLVLLQAVADGGEEAMRPALTHLQSAEFLYETSLFPDVEYTFKHALTHEVAYGSLLGERRRGLHTLIMETIERLYPDSLGEHVDSLARHASASEIWGKAAHYSRQAALKASERSAHREAVGWFEHSLAAQERLPENATVLQHAIETRLELRGSLIRLGKFPRILDELRRAEDHARALGSRIHLARVAADLSDYYWIAGAYRDAVESGQTALTLSTGLNDPELEASSGFCLGQAYHALGDSRALDFLRTSLRRVQGDTAARDLNIFAYASTWLIWCLAERGVFAEGEALADEVLRLAEVRDEPWLLFHVYFGTGVLHVLKGEINRGISLLQCGLTCCEAADFPFGFPMIGPWLGLARSLAGDRSSDVLGLSEQAVADAEATGFHGLHSLRLSSLADVHFQAGRYDDSLRTATRALGLARSHEERTSEASILRLLGDIRSFTDEPSNAEACYHGALRRSEHLVLRPLVAHCHLGLGKLYRRTGKRQQAQEHLTTATTMYREMEMTYWLEQAEKERAGQA
jgi:class 3 adenylate cyclase/tetratricopeptide (TPR) repeat protein